MKALRQGLVLRAGCGGMAAGAQVEAAGSWRVYLPAVRAGDPAPCSCEGNLCNYADFGTQAEEQVYCKHCLALGNGDVHWLDGDEDEVACEGWP